MKHHEDNLQQSCVQLFRFKYPRKMIFAIPNGGKRNPREAHRLRLQGVLAGVPDLCIASPNKCSHGLYIELKIHPNKPTQNQLEVISFLRAQNYQVEIVYSIQEFEQIIKDYFDN